MAFSQSIGKAQTPAVCQFCEESTEIKWKCINCELFLCQLCCSKIHSKSKASMEHEIINLQDVETDNFATSMRKVDLDNMECTKHIKQKCFFYCNKCSEPACSECVVETHKLHDFKAIGEVYKDIISEMKKLNDTFESNIQIFRNKKDKLQKMLSDGDTNFQETKEIILQTEKELKERISKHAKDFVQKLEARWKSSENMIKTELSTMKKNEDELETRKNNLNQALQSHQAADIFSTSKILDKPLPKYSTRKINHNKAKFIPRYNQGIIGSWMFGELCTIPKMELIDTYPTNVEDLTNILLSIDNSSAIIGSYKSKKLQKIKIENHNIKVEKEFQIAVIDMTLTNNEGILVSSGESDLKQYTKEGQLMTFKSFSPLKTLGVHFTKHDQIIVGLTESFPVVTSSSKDSIRRLVIMNQAGDIHHTIEYDSDNTRMLTYPYKISSGNNILVVVDIINKKWEGKIVKVDYGGHLYWTYNGCQSIISKPFCPRDVAITSSDMIIVTDDGSHAIHVISSYGENIMCKDLKSLGIELPWSLSIDKNEVLWIGCRKLGTDKSKILRVKLI
ncbi:Hypothetical predicted protein [Mytilus galloprovincialis]|uniref:B box-type domain-containing protein n=1 Tax=Mytilus galloprovincialis TaxID=29158 RepID=A0A8B6GAZ4_MYTGA|nr:Hypothetical predicted protein [Mytilus galloprovincialis]